MKKLELSVGQLRAAAPALSELGAMTLPPPVSFRIARILGQVQPVLDQFSSHLSDLLPQYATQNEELPDRWEFKSARDRADFSAASDSLLGELVAIEFQPISIDDMGEKPVTPSTLAAVMWIFNED